MLIVCCRPVRPNFIGKQMSNISFRAIRRYAQYEWEVYFDSTSNGYVAICHLFSGNVQAETWDDIWLEIIKSSKKQIKLEKKNRCNRR